MSRPVPMWLDRAIEQVDWFRRPPSRVGGAGGFKEWHHFCVYGAGIDLLINFSEVDDVREGRDEGVTFARMTVLARLDRWHGGVERYEAGDVDIRGGSIRARIGGNHLAYDGGAYRLSVECRDHAIRGELGLVPLAMPAPIHNVVTGDGPPIHWVVVPRLAASGWVEVDGVRFVLDEAPAYHDHNWGHFRWGRDFAWEWGFGLPQDPDDPWSFVFARLSGRRLVRTRMQTLFLWKGNRVQRAFRDDRIRIRHRGLFRAERVHKVPPVMRLVSRGLATDVPAEMTIEAWSADSRLEACFRPRDVAQVILPNDDDLGVTIINEVAGDLEVEARVRDETVRIHCPTIFEFLGA